MYIKYRMALYEKVDHPPIVSRSPATTLFCVDSGDRFSTTYDNYNKPRAVGQNDFNNFIIEKKQNLLQGKYTRIGVTEVRFPYNIPNVNARNNKVYISADSNPYVTITIPEGFYTGAQLATILQTQLNASVAPLAGYTVTYTTDGRFSIRNATLVVLPFEMSPIGTAVPTPGTPAYDQYIYEYNTTRSLLDLIGFSPIQGADLITPDIGSGGTGAALIGGYADLRYTDYIDVVSQQLTNYQKGKDSTTQNAVPRSNLIYRIFIENENSINSVTNVTGTSPFVIYRQINNPKMIRWNNDSSIGQIDISLYDMYGDPLYVPTYTPLLTKKEVIMPDFQITFLASED